MLVGRLAITATQHLASAGSRCHSVTKREETRFRVSIIMIVVGIGTVIIIITIIMIIIVLIMIIVVVSVVIIIVTVIVIVSALRTLSGSGAGGLVTVLGRCRGLALFCLFCIVVICLVVFNVVSFASHAPCYTLLYFREPRGRCRGLAFYVTSAFYIPVLRFVELPVVKRALPEFRRNLVNKSPLQRDVIGILKAPCWGPPHYKLIHPYLALFR